MTIPVKLKRLLSNKYMAVTILALIWATFIHDLGLPFVIREAMGPIRQERRTGQR